MKWVFQNIAVAAKEAKSYFGGKEINIVEDHEDLIKKGQIHKHRDTRIIPLRVSKLDQHVSDHGLESGSTILISGGCGTGKTTFVLQSIYSGLMNGEKAVFISFEEEPFKVKQHMKKNYNWDFSKFEKAGKFLIIKLDPLKIARSVEESLSVKKGQLAIEYRKFNLPFNPDRIGVDSLSALAIAFENEQKYREYLRELFETLEEYNSLNFVISETEQDPKIYSRSGVEEFLTDGVLVLYNIRHNDKRRKAIEILKLRSSSHTHELIPFKITSNGIEILS